MYAPGDHTYQVIRLRLSVPEFLQAHEIAYPPSELYHFGPLDETVPVYETPFRFVQEVTIPMSREIVARARAGDTLAIEGTLEYQACDHEICCVPAEAPIRWEVDWRPLIFN